MHNQNWFQGTMKKETRSLKELTKIDLLQTSKVAKWGLESYNLGLDSKGFSDSSEALKRRAKS